MKTPKEVIISAPGKVILHGEHSVVYGKVAVAAGVNLRAFLRLRCISAPEVRLHLPDVRIDKTFKVADLTALFSRQLGDPLSPAPITEELLERFKTFCEVSADSSDTAHLAVIAFLYLYGNIGWTSGSLIPMDVTLASTQPVGAGLGSSASFSVCLATALLSATEVISPCQSDQGDVSHRTWSGEDKKLINGWGFEGERIIHGKPSGIDNSMATYGGALKFQSGKIEQLGAMPRLRILLTNTKVPRSTKVLVAGVRERFNRLPEVFGPVFDAMEGVSQRGIDTYSKMVDSPSEEHYNTLKELIDVNQGLLRLIGVSHPQLESIVTRSAAGGVHSKLTGAGGGGCALSLITPDTPETVISDLKREFTGLGFGCWETSVGGEGVLIHDSLDTTFSLPSTFQQS